LSAVDTSFAIAVDVVVVFRWERTTKATRATTPKHDTAKKTTKKSTLEAFEPSPFDSSEIAEASGAGEGREVGVRE